MLWVLLSITAALLWASVNVVDKHILSKIVQRPVVPVMILGVVGLIASVSIFFIHGFAPMPAKFIIFALIGGCFYFLGNYFYLKAITTDDVSKIIPLVHIAPLFIAISAAIFLGEIFTPVKYLGIFFLVAGAFLVSLKNLKSISLGRGFWFMMLADLSIATTETLTKFLFNSQADFWTVFALVRLGAFLAILPIIYINRQLLADVYRQKGIKTYFILFSNQIVNFGGILSLTTANMFGYVTLVNALSSLQSFFVLMFATAFSVFLPNFLKEEAEIKTVARRLIAIIIIITGALLIS